MQQSRHLSIKNRYITGVPVYIQFQKIGGLLCSGTTPQARYPVFLRGLNCGGVRPSKAAPWVTLLVYPTMCGWSVSQPFLSRAEPFLSRFRRFSAQKRLATYSFYGKWRFWAVLACFLVFNRYRLEIGVAAPSND